MDIVFGIIGLIIWIAIAFWPARVARRKGHSFLGYFILSLVFFPLAIILAYFGRWSLELYGKNLTNEQGITEINAAGPLPNGALGLGLIRPRTVGISVATRFWGT
mgnify:CR=1 FL=1